MITRRCRTSVRSVAATLVVVGLALAGAACGGGDDSAAGPVPSAPQSPTTVATVTPTTLAPPSTTVSPVGLRYGVGVRTTTYVDPSRPTSAIDGFAGAPDRTLPVTIWYPAEGDPGAAPVADAPADRRGGPYPLVLFSHGYAVTPDYYAALLEQWAAAGYVVAAPTYPLLSGTPAGPSHVDYGKVFADNRFVLTQLLADLGPTGPIAHPLAGTIDATRVAAAGQSDGEVAAFGAGFLECCRDSRVKAVVAMAGNLGNINNPVQSANGVPVLHLVGEADELQPYAEAIAWDRDNLSAPRWIVTLVRGTHAPPYRDPADPHFAGVVDLTTAFLDGTLKGDPTRLAAVDTVVGPDPARFRLER